MKFPKDLLNAAISGEALALVGSGPSVAAGLPTWAKLLELMINECEEHAVAFSDSDELRNLLRLGYVTEVADECRAHLGGSLYRDFMQRIFQQTVAPSETHKLICRLGFSAILTTNYDNLLEKAYMQTRKNCGIPPVYTQKNVAQLARLANEKSFFILKMHGDVEDIETIVLTDSDYQGIMHQHPAYRKALANIFANKTVVFIGYGHADSHLNIILSEQVSVFRGFGRRHFAFFPDAGKILSKSFSKKYNITVIPYDSKDNHAELMNKLSSLLQEVNTRRRQITKPRSSQPSTVRQCPYKLLDYYDAADRNLFFGRRDETISVLQSLRAHRLLVLFGRSGVGKTSLLKAGILPGLEDSRYLTIYCRFTEPKLRYVLDEFSRIAGISFNRIDKDPKKSANLILKVTQQIDKISVLILDQFEKIFLDFKKSSFLAIAEFLRTLLDNQPPRCHVLISIREDLFAKLNDFTAYIPDIFNNRYELTELSLTTAEQAIRGPAKAVGIKCSDSFVRNVLRDLNREGIEPAQLQIVCTAVFDALQPGSNRIDMRIYKKLGRAETILSGYVGNVLNNLIDDDRDAAREILKCFVSPGGSRAFLSRKTLFDQLGSKYNKQQIKSIMDTLVLRRLVRIVKHRSTSLLELSHDLLISEIRKWISNEEREIRRMQEVMELERNICESLDTVISLKRALFLKRHAENANFTEADCVLIERSIEQGKLEEKQRELMEERKRKLASRLQQAQKMEAIGTLAGGIAHDFNNLLMGTQGNISLMLLDIDSSHPHYERLKNIEKQVQSGAKLTRQLLGFSRGGKYEPRPTDLNELLKESSDMFGRTRKEIRIHSKYEEDIWTVEVDPGQIEQVLMNLYINAWQAMPTGGELRLKTENVMLDEHYVKPYDVEPGNYVKIAVSDSGVGIDEAIQKRIFEPFFTTRKAETGAGLGLAVAYGVINNHSGIMNVDSKKGEGSTFNVCLPASEKKLPTVAVGKVAEEVIKGTETILLVDDEDLILEVGRELLEALGYHVLVANGGKEAIEIYKRKRDDIDLVLTDMVMPDMGGGKVYDKVKEINPGANVLLASGYSIDGEAKEILNRGCDGFLQKPFTMKKASTKIRKILEKK